MLNNLKPQTLILACWTIATTATLGSLFFSEIMRFPPCALCWYQRIFMYPLVILFLVGSFKDIKSTVDFTLPVIALGWFFALYHNLLHYEIVPETASPCLEGVSCSTVYINLLGFITIPMMSFIAFSILMGLILLLKKGIKNEK